VPFTLIDAHLSAFDAGARLRARQLAELLRLASAEYADGRHVVIGADFNYELCPSPRPHTTDPNHMAWLHPFPWQALPAGWRIAADPATPTFRSADKPYARGENYAGIIDGFIASPNVEILGVAGIDLDFAWSDHNPVALTVRARVDS
jgi:endonuclease/exonuclease/phosphatase family metal-dependent hydrolase